LDQPPVLRPDVARWLRSLAEIPRDPVLDEMHGLARERNFPIVGPEVGRLLWQVAFLCKAHRIFEMGSGFGYSTLWWARSLPEGGKVFHTDTDARNTEKAREFLRKAGVEERVEFRVGDAREILRDTPGEFDVIFCDIDKEQYPEAYRIFRDRVRQGGAVVVDNLVWSGRPAAGDRGKSTEGVREYIRLMWNDPHFLSSLLPVRDGVGLSIRIR
jgi:caffeoyl-CoA O-methyltransferase